MFHFFRINDPYRLLGLLIIFLIIYLPFFINIPSITYPELKSLVVGEKIAAGSLPYVGLVDSTAPLTCWFYGFIHFLFGKSLLARHIVAFILIFLQSAFIGIIYIQKKAFTESTYLPSLVFLVLSFFSFDNVSLTGELLAAGVLLLALNSLFKEIEFRSQRDETIFGLGVSISIASLFNFSCIVFVVASYLILILYTRSTLRSFLLLAFGFLLPHLMLLSIYFLFDHADVLWQYYYLPNLSISANYFVGSKSLLFLAGVPLFFLLASFVILNREARFTKYQAQLLQIMFLWMLFAFIQVLYSKDIRPQSFITLVPGIGFFITHFLLIIRRKRFAEISLWILFLSVISITYLSSYGRIKQVGYQDLVVTPAPDKWKGKRILALENDNLPLFLHNSLATPYLNWDLSKRILGQPDYYEHVDEVYEAIRRDPPDVIIDKNDYMESFMNRIPMLKNQYQQTEAGVYYKRLSN